MNHIIESVLCRLSCSANLVPMRRAPAAIHGAARALTVSEAVNDADGSPPLATDCHAGLLTAGFERVCGLDCTSGDIALMSNLF